MTRTTQRSNARGVSRRASGVGRVVLGVGVVRVTLDLVGRGIEPPEKKRGGSKKFGTLGNSYGLSAARRGGRAPQRGRAAPRPGGRAAPLPPAGRAVRGA